VHAVVEEEEEEEKEFTADGGFADGGGGGIGRFGVASGAGAFTAAGRTSLGDVSSLGAESLGPVVGFFLPGGLLLLLLLLLPLFV